MIVRMTLRLRLCVLRTEGENVVVESGDEDRPFVGEILKLYRTGFRPMALVQWYYWPEDTSSGRLHFHGSNELFKSDHRDWIEVSTIINSCKIYSFDDYEVRESLTNTEISGNLVRVRVKVVCI